MSEQQCIFFGCASTDQHWHGGFPGGYDNPNDPTGPPISFTSEPAPGVRDYNGALLEDPTEHLRQFINGCATCPRTWTDHRDAERESSPRALPRRVQEPTS